MVQQDENDSFSKLTENRMCDLAELCKNRFNTLGETKGSPKCSLIEGGAHRKIVLL